MRVSMHKCKYDNDEGRGRGGMGIGIAITILMLSSDCLKEISNEIS